MNVPRSADGDYGTDRAARTHRCQAVGVGSVQRCHEVFDTMIRSLLILRWIMLKSDRELQVAL